MITAELHDKAVSGLSHWGCYIMLLSQLSVGDVATVTALHASTDIRRRLRDIGLIEGTQVECLMLSPLGDPAAYMIRGAIIALRRKDAETVEIERKGH